MKHSPGHYMGHIVDVYAGKAKHKKQSPLITFVVTISMFYDTIRKEWVESSNEKRDFSTFLTQDTMPYTVKKLIGMGFNPHGDPTDPKLTDLPEEITGHGQGIQLVCSHNAKGYEEWEPQCWIDAVSSGGGDRKNSLDQMSHTERDTVRSFFKNAVSAVK